MMLHNVCEGDLHIMDVDESNRSANFKYTENQIEKLVYKDMH